MVRNTSMMSIIFTCVPTHFADDVGGGVVDGEGIVVELEDALMAALHDHHCGHIRRADLRLHYH